ncbi:unnamed protein product [Urochloa decumbens]|uniref:Cytochrome P450 n=1 Tax=Urochloa decumbens TaxID=240449 RepID=A0ABC9DYP8_9POAL
MECTPMLYFLLALLPLLCFLKSHLASRISHHGNSLRLPPSPWQLPIIGSLHHLHGALPHHALRKLARRHGLIMLLKFGEVPVIVASSREAAKEILKTHDAITATRPQTTTFKILSKRGQGIALAPYGDHWRQLRKICNMELLSQKHVQSFWTIREDEAARLVQSIASPSASPMNLSKMLAGYVADAALRAIMGDRLRDRDAFIQQLAEGDLFAGSNDTSATTLQWTMAELMRNPGVMLKLQDEVRGAFAAMTKVTEEGLQSRESIERCQILGYEVPKGTMVMVNAGALSIDPEYWDEPEVFRPERFEDTEKDFKGNEFEFIPFGAGRRICPGMFFGLANIELALANLVFYFDWSLPEGVSCNELDMTESAGITVRKKSDLWVRATPHAMLAR